MYDCYPVNALQNVELAFDFRGLRMTCNSDVAYNPMTFVFISKH